MPRHAHIDIDSTAITENVRGVRAVVGPTDICAVVKADGYGHGATTAARAALEGGATWLAVALVEEGRILRDAGVDAPILVLSEPPVDAMADTLDAGLTPTVYSARAIEAAASCVRERGVERPWGVHLKIDTGMHRVGVDVGDAVALARTIASMPELELAGTFTHLAVADEPERVETADQLELFNRVLSDLRAAGIDPGVRHVANSAAALRCPGARFDMVRIGIALYGYSPFGPESAEARWLTPAMMLSAEVTHTRRVAGGEGVSYGLRHRFERDSITAVVPLGYADGIDRRFGAVGGHVLIGGMRHAVRGVVTMDQMVVEVTPGVDVRCGDRVVLIGTQGAESVSVYEWADLLGTIPYEVVCRFGVRLPRRANPSRGKGDQYPLEPAAGSGHTAGPAGRISP